MISLGRILLRTLAGIEIVLFSIYLIWGTHGVRAIHALQEKNELLMQQMSDKEFELDAARAEIADWKEYPFYKEQYAREHLQMAHKDDEIYLI